MIDCLRSHETVTFYNKKPVFFANNKFFGRKNWSEKHGFGLNLDTKAKRDNIKCALATFEIIYFGYLFSSTHIYSALVFTRNRNMYEKERKKHNDYSVF